MKSSSHVLNPNPHPARLCSTGTGRGIPYISWMKRYIFYLLLSFFLTTTIWAQEAIVRSFEANPMDLAAQRYKRTDTHGNVCALIKIQAVTAKLDCTGSVIGPVEEHNLNEFWLYVPSDAKMVKIFYYCPLN